MTSPSQKSTLALEKLDAIEAELKRLDWWDNSPPDLRAQVRAGKIRSYLDAPSFELWLQCIFLPNAREAASTEAWPSHSQVGLMASREYDYHSYVPQAQTLLGLLRDFDHIVTGAS